MVCEETTTRRPTLLCASSTHMHMLLSTSMTSYLNAIRNMIMSKRENISKGSERWNICLLHPTGPCSNRWVANKATYIYKRSASLYALKWDKSYNSSMSWLCCQMSFSLLCLAIQCIRGTRSIWCLLVTTSNWSGHLWVRAWHSLTEITFIFIFLLQYNYSC